MPNGVFPTLTGFELTTTEYRPLKADKRKKLIRFFAPENKKTEENRMTRLQQEMARRLPSIGCSSKYDSVSGILHIALNEQPICRLHSDGNYTYRSDEHQSDKQAECFLKVEDMIDSAKEYISAYENAPKFEINGIKDYRKLSEFNGVVFGAKDMGSQYGFQFSSWLLTYNRTGAMLGDYSYNYESSKQAFAERSELVDKYLQFSNEELEDFYRCLGFTKDTNYSLTYDQERTLEKLMDKIEYILPYVRDNPDYQFEQNEDDGMTME